MENEKIKNGDFLFKFSAGLFIVILISTICMYFYNSSLESSLNNSQIEIGNIKNSISELKTNKSLQVYNLYNINKSTIDNAFVRSNINNNINFLKLQSAKYGIDFSGFAYDGKTIQTTLNSSTDRNLGYLKLSKFIADYRNPINIQNNNITLGLIENITGNDKLNTAITFNLK